MNFGVHLPVIDFGNQRFSLERLSAYVETAKEFGFKPVSTLEIIYGRGGVCDYAPPPPLCFTDKVLLAQLSPRARRIFDYFIRTYEPSWEKN